jgi:hypothetical protein
MRPRRRSRRRGRSALTFWQGLAANIVEPDSSEAIMAHHHQICFEPATGSDREERWSLPQAALFALSSSLLLWYLIIRAALWLIG